jgi:hypothetical protein
MLFDVYSLGMGSANSLAHFSPVWYLLLSPSPADPRPLPSLLPDPLRQPG